MSLACTRDVECNIEPCVKSVILPLLHEPTGVPRVCHSLIMDRSSNNDWARARRERCFKSDLAVPLFLFRVILSVGFAAF